MASYDESIPPSRQHEMRKCVSARVQPLRRNLESSRHFVRVVPAEVEDLRRRDMEHVTVHRRARGRQRTGKDPGRTADEDHLGPGRGGQQGAEVRERGRDLAW